MTDSNSRKNVSDEHVSNLIVAQDEYPEVSVSVVHFLDDEVQIEQGSGKGAIDLRLGSDNDIVSVSPKQARAIAKQILTVLGDE